MSITFQDFTRYSDELFEEISECFSRVMRRGNYILGEEVRAFETEWACFCRAKGAVGTANGTDAITLALTASNKLENGKENEVITTPLTAGYTALGIVNAGAKPVFVDIDEKTYNLDPAKIEQSITPRTKGITAVHLYGQTADMRAIVEIAERHNLFVIEDAAQAHGALFDEKPCGFSSLAATFSFYPTKNLGAIGDGGAVVSNDEELLKNLRLLRQGGHYEAMQINRAGSNSRLDEVQAAILRVKLKTLAEWNERRRKLAKIYFERLKHLPNLRLPFVRNEAEAVFHLFVVRHPQRDKLKAFLAENGIGCAVHYPYLLHEQNLFRSPEQKSLPVAEKVVKEILSLPLYPQLTESEVEQICDAIGEFENKNASVFSHNANR